MTTTTIKAGYKQTEIGVIPEDWEVKTLGLLGVFSKGQGIRKDEASSGQIPCVRYGELYTRHNDVLRKYYSHISPTVAKTSKRLKTGDILFAGSGETKEEIGKCVAFLDDFEVYAGGDIVLFSPTKAVSNFLGYLLNSSRIAKEKASRGQGDAVVHISATALSSVQIPVPPNPEQKLIATTLSDTDELISSLDALISKKRRMKEGAMQELLTGKKRLAGFSGEWEVKKLGEIANFYDNLRVPITESKRENGITPYYGANGIQGYIKGHTHNGEFVLIAEDGANDLNNYPVLYISGKIWVNNHAHVIQGMKGCVNTKYLSYALKTVNFVQVLVGGTRAKLNGSVAKLIQLSYPKNKEEQQAIAKILSDMDTEIIALEQKRDKYKLIKQGMMQQLLTGKIRLI